VLFNTISYVVFLAIAAGVTWVLPTRHRIHFLLAASLLFYALWRVEFVLLITFSAWIDYFFSLKIHQSEQTNRRRLFLVASLSVNLILLLYFKYTYFLLDNFALLSNLVGAKWHLDPGSIVLPLGISFYTFLSISYTVDVYRRTFEPVRSFTTYLCYVMFWPHMIAGPILRAQELLPQLGKVGFDLENVVSGIRYILAGLFLKVVLADNISPSVDAAFASDPSRLSALDVWTMAFAFGFQIYFDFAGYSMIAIGSARLLNVHFPENFNWPYVAASPREFWKRWHITLSSWIRDYLYLPLSGAKFRTRSTGGLEIGALSHERHGITIAALFLTWLLMGLWHGANWTFAFWGLWHAAFIFLYRVLSKFPVREGKALVICGWLITLAISMLSWIPFRSPSVPFALELLSKVIDPRSYNRLSFRENFYLMTGTLFFGMILFFGISRLLPALEPRPRLRFVVETGATAAVFFLVFVFLRPINQFIYFQF
jgi:alginate O-acetyltransferase complex protein AlgI